ncbi:ferritin family protein [Bradyrhizobium ottawaense]
MPFLRTSLLSAEPAGVLESLDELFALAHAMEQEAANRYESLAQDMRGQGKADLAEVFTKLAAAEREHVDSVTQWSQSRRGKSPDPALVRWEAPEALAPEAAAEVKTSRRDDTVPRARHGGPQRRASLRILVLSRRLFQGP